MFGGGAKKEKKDEGEDRGDVSGSAKSQREAAAAAKGDDEVSHSNNIAWTPLTMLWCV
jgi:hypothetical protein